MSTAAIEINGVRYLQTVSVDPATGNAIGSAASPQQVAVKPSALQVTTTFTRPANVTPYTALDNVGAAAAAVTFAAFGEAGKKYMITSAFLEMDFAAIPANMVGFRLHLFNVTPPSTPADNAAFNLIAGDRASYLGYVDISAPLDLGDTLYCQDLNIGKQIELLGTSLFGVLQTLGGYTPANNSEVYKLGLTRIEV